MSGFFVFLSSPLGRLARIIDGATLILIGLFIFQGTLGSVLMIVGVALLLAGVFDFCVLAPLFGLPFRGARLRQSLEQDQ